LLGSPLQRVTMPARPKKSRGPFATVLMGALNVVVAVFILLDELARPLYRPLLRWVASLRMIEAMERQVAKLPPYGVLVALAVPFFGVEPLKLLGFYWLGTGRPVIGVAMLVFSYAAGFILVERVYNAGRDKLLTIRWFVVVLDFVVAIRDGVLNRMRRTRAWIVAKRYSLKARILARRAFTPPAE